ncbi:probable E3 ubiquitin-protein ligase RHA4A isoform X1 [Malania oleifera]|uniref:probable E3 ubiquitin-protein ligase RHA4A isoform X1 n=1 Tax=Malania oleifera TaxID=397392 RepID=UPI0025AE33D7|nr:probable E3 ubiquitin-protein ligase RHA4A isoform X1 [Malania oleifera]
MGFPQNPASPPHFYPQALQLKLYQAFIFSIPILFSIILFLLFYLFYLKRRTSTAIPSSQLPPQTLVTLNQDSSFVPLPREVGLKGDLKDKLPIVLFDEDLRAKDSQCSVCLKEFEMKEELHQLPSCKHVFHIDCIHHWLHSNSTCPLCRSLVIPHPTTKHEQIREQEAIVDHHQVRSLSSTTNFTGSDEQNTIQIGHQGSISSLRESPAGRMGDELGCPDRESVVLHIQTHTSS